MSVGHWWDREPRRGKQGDIVSTQTGLPILCPSCKEAPVVYNGNYFCDDWGDTCDWALAHPARSRRDRLICNLIGIDYR